MSNSDTYLFQQKIHVLYEVLVQTNSDLSTLISTEVIRKYSYDEFNWEESYFSDAWCTVYIYCNLGCEVPRPIHCDNVHCRNQFQITLSCSVLYEMSAWLLVSTVRSTTCEFTFWLSYVTEFSPCSVWYASCHFNIIIITLF